MSREVVIVQRCDTCREPATESFVVGAISGEAQPMLHLIDVCDLHAVPLIELEAAWSKLAPWTNGDASMPQLVRRRQRAGLDDLACKLCGKYLKNQGSLTHHIWSQHVGRPRAVAGPTCPDCGRTFGSNAATGMHRKKEHGFDVVTEAYAEARKASKG